MILCCNPDGGNCGVTNNLPKVSPQTLAGGVVHVPVVGWGPTCTTPVPFIIIIIIIIIITNAI